MTEEQKTVWPNTRKKNIQMAKKTNDELMARCGDLLIDATNQVSREMLDNGIKADEAAFQVSSLAISLAIKLAASILQKKMSQDEHHEMLKSIVDELYDAIDMIDDDEEDNPFSDN